MAEMLNFSLQENLITLLAYDKTHGKIVANMLNIELMEGDYRMIAERCIDYWRKYKTAPGDHTADLFADILEDKHNRRSKTISRHLRSMIALSESINTRYVMQQLSDFNRLQRFKKAIVESAEKINNNAQMALGEIEEIWNSLLRTREIEFSAGMRINEVARVMQRLEELASEFRTGIPDLDKRFIVPQRGKVFLLGGAAGRGKTWGLIHIGKTALQDRKKVVHLTCEIDEEEVIGRYWQSMFSVPKRGEPIKITEFEKEMGKLEGIKQSDYDPDFNLSWGTAKMELESHLGHMGQRADNIVVKRFKPNELTGNAIRAYLDTLEQVEGFIPDMLILDYLGLMKINAANVKQSMTVNTVEFRALCIERDIAGVTAHQLSKAGEMAAMAKGTHLADDWNMVGTCDTIVIYSCTDLEFRYGLGRLYVAKCRADADRFACLITQNYAIGQFCLESSYLSKAYEQLFKDLTANSDDYDADEDEEDEDGDDE